MKTVPAIWYGEWLNAGDMVTPWLIRRLGGEPVMCNDNEPGLRIIGCGSIIVHANERSIVWGSGIGNRTDVICPKARFLAVRGPLSRQRVLECGGVCPEVYGDPALLLPRFYEPSAQQRAPLGIVPHHIDFELAKSKAGEGVRVIDILQPIEKVIDDIAACERVVSSSLHGLVFSVAYGVPVSWAKISNRLCGDGVKFHDFWRSLWHDNDAMCVDLLGEWPSTEELMATCTDWGRLDTTALWQSCPIRWWLEEGENADGR
jgi:hypothetical protein